MEGIKGKAVCKIIKVYEIELNVYMANVTNQAFTMQDLVNGRTGDYRSAACKRWR